MKTFLAEHNGIWLGGYSIVVAKNRQQARMSLIPVIKDFLKEYKKDQKISIKLTEIDDTEPNIVLISNGDY